MPLSFLLLVLLVCTAPKGPFPVSSGMSWESVNGSHPYRQEFDILAAYEEGISMYFVKINDMPIEIRDVEESGVGFYLPAAFTQALEIVPSFYWHFPGTEETGPKAVLINASTQIAISTPVDANIRYGQVLSPAATYILKTYRVLGIDGLPEEWWEEAREAVGLEPEEADQPE